MFELAHITDVHQPPLPNAAVGELLSKRFFGFLSWHHRRHKIHRREALNALLGDLAKRPADHIAVTGDLVNIALPDEFKKAATWLKQLGPPEEVSLIPGNHDAYVDGAWQTGWRQWSPYMCGDETSTGFPYLRRLSNFAIIGLSTAVPTPIGFAGGRLGGAQLDKLESILANLREDGVFRIVLIHHPPLGERIKRRRGLQDEAAFSSIIAKSGAELILGGHEHRFLFGQLPGRDGLVPIFAGPSASLSPSEGDRFGGYLRYRLDPDDRQSVQVEICRYDPTTQTISNHQSFQVKQNGSNLELAQEGSITAP